MSIIEDGAWDDAPDSKPAAPPTVPNDRRSGVPAGTPDPPPDAPAEAPPLPSAADLRKLLRARIAAVLQARTRHTSAGGAQERAEATSKQTMAEFRALALPATEDPARLRDYITSLEERYRHHMKSVDAVDEARLATAQAEHAWQKSCEELSRAVSQAAPCQELSNDDVLAAASHMSARLAPPPKTIKEAPKESTLEDAELTDTEVAQIAALRHATFEAVSKSARAFAVGPAIVSAVGAVKSSACPDVKPPVRPTEEEIQRYLRQTDTAVIDRQRAHHALPALLTTRTSTLAELEASQQQLSEAIAAVRSVARASRRPQSAPVLATADLVMQISRAAEAGLGDDYDAGKLEKSQRKTPTARETRQIAELRDLMRQVAFVRGSLNEATVTLSGAKVGRDRAFTLSGVAEARTWQECLDWRQRKAAEQLTTERVNLTRKTKVELLTELVAQHERDAVAAATTLYRYVMAIKPPDERPPSDQFKAVINAAAWICNPEANGHNRSRPGDFPIY